MEATETKVGLLASITIDLLAPKEFVAPGLGSVKVASLVAPVFFIVLSFIGSTTNPAPYAGM